MAIFTTARDSVELRNFSDNFTTTETFAISVLLVGALFMQPRASEY